MTVSYLLAPEPYWTIINNEGTVAGGAKMYTRRALNHDQDKAIYKDASNNIPWTNPVIFDLNGVQGPFYWASDSNDLDETYYVFVTDADDNLLWDIDDFFPGGSGGGGNVTTYLPLTNYIANNQFVDHVEATTTTALTDLIIAPSNHKGFTPAQSNPVVGTNGVVGPDIRFLKNSTANTDNISFPLFALGSAPLFPTDVTPVDYVRYQCTTSNAGETYKCFQFPITQKIKNLSNQVMTFKVWAAVAATPATLTAYIRQYFGSGTAASAEVRTSIGTMSLTTTWTSFFLSFTVPSVAAKSIGTPGLQTDDDAIYIQLQMPLNAACDIYFTKPALYLGDIDLAEEFETYDQISAITYAPRTGDVKTSFSSVAPRGWVPMNDGTIGNTGSGATLVASQVAFQLYSTIYTTVSDTWAPVSGGRTAPGNTMATAVTDFLAGKTLTLPRSLGRALAGAGAGSGLTSRALGEYVGAETHTLITSEIPSHHHSGLFVTSASSTSGPGAFVAFTPVATNTGDTGGDGAHANMQPTSFMNVFIKL